MQNDPTIAYTRIHRTVARLIDSGVQDVSELIDQTRRLCSPKKLTAAIDRLRADGFLIGEDKLSLTRRGQAIVPVDSFRDKTTYQPPKTGYRRESHANIPSVMGSQLVDWKNPI